MQSLKNHGRCEKTKRYKTCSNQSKKALFSIRNKLSYNEIVFIKVTSHRKKQQQFFMNKPVYLGLAILEIISKK